MASRNDSAAAAPIGLGVGVLATIVVTVAAWLAMGPEAGIVVLILAAICLVVFGVYRVGGTARNAATDNTDGTPRLRAEGERPLGDTPEAHDEINPHDLPPDHPGRHAAERMAEGDDGETAGMDEGGAAGAGGSEADASGREEPTGEARRGATTGE